MLMPCSAGEHSYDVRLTCHPSGGKPRARPHCHSVPPLIQFLPYSLR
jgi:hypothetical protein